MANQEFFGIVEFSLTTGLVPWGDPSEYVQKITGTVQALTDDGAEEQAGSITLRLVSAAEAANNGESLYDVCDADSALLESVYVALFDDDGELREELDIEPAWSNLLVVENVNVEPAYRDSTARVQMIETAMSVFCDAGLVIAVEESLKLSLAEWRQVGFQRIAGSGLVIRDQLRINPYRQSSS